MHITAGSHCYKCTHELLNLCLSAPDKTEARKCGLVTAIMQNGARIQWRETDRMTGDENSPTVLQSLHLRKMSAGCQQHCYRLTTLTTILHHVATSHPTSPEIYSNLSKIQKKNPTKLFSVTTVGLVAAIASGCKIRPDKHHTAIL